MTSNRHRLVMLGGPSCAGKSPLKEALTREFSELTKDLCMPVLYHSRAPRPDEKDGESYHFRSREEIERLGLQKRYLAVEVRQDVQAVDLQEMGEVLRHSDVFYEGNEHIALELKRRLGKIAEVVDVYVSPLRLDEVRELGDDTRAFVRQVTELMRQRLIRRASAKKTFLALPDLDDVEKRARSTFHSLGHAHEFSYVLPNHDGEDSDHWRTFSHPVGDARRAVQALAKLLRGERSDLLETWPEDLIELDRGACPALGPMRDGRP